VLHVGPDGRGQRWYISGTDVRGRVKCPRFPAATCVNAFKRLDFRSDLRRCRANDGERQAGSPVARPARRRLNPTDDGAGNVTLLCRRCLVRLGAALHIDTDLWNGPTHDVIKCAHHYVACVPRPTTMSRKSSKIDSSDLL